MVRKLCVIAEASWYDGELLRFSGKLLHDSIVCLYGIANENDIIWLGCMTVFIENGKEIYI